jgi:hypothetical protein
MATSLQDIAFAPCTSNTFMASALKMGMGHVPSALPLPFTFPTIAGGSVLSLGSFIDLTVIHDSDTQGAFLWPYVQDVWSPLGYASLGGTNFIWNGVDDVAFFVTHQGATGTSGMHRSSTEPFRVYASSYQSGPSSASGPAGLKMRFEMAPVVLPVPTLTVVGTGCIGSSGLPMTLGSLQLPFIGNPTFSLDVAQGPASSTAYLFASFGISSFPAPIGPGCSVYLDLTTLQLLINQGFSPIGPLPTGPTGATSFNLAVPPDPTIAGFSIAFQAAVTDNTPVGVVLSNAVLAVIY